MENLEPRSPSPTNKSTNERFRSRISLTTVEIIHKASESTASFKSEVFLDVLYLSANNTVADITPAAPYSSIDDADNNAAKSQHVATILQATTEAATEAAPQATTQATIF